MDMTVLLKIIGALGGRKFVLAIITTILDPILALYLPAEVAKTVIAAITSIAMTFIAAQGYADGASQGKTSTTMQV